jgi:hypothetical protein
MTIGRRAGWQRFLVIADAVFIEERLIDQFSVIITHASAETSAASVPGRIGIHSSSRPAPVSV